MTSHMKKLEIEPFKEIDIVEDDCGGDLKLVAKNGSNVNVHIINQGEHKNYDLDIMADAKVSLLVFNIGHKNFENQIKINLAEKNASLEFFALEILGKNAIGNTSLNIRHKAPHTSSMQEIKGIYAHSSKSHFLGKVVIEENASGSKALQRYQSLLLDREASAHVMPQLEINNNDISAKHGASIGELDKNMIFYLCSRGLSQNDAKAMLLNGLAQKILLEIKCAPIKAKIGPLIEKSIRDSLGGSDGSF